MHHQYSTDKVKCEGAGTHTRVRVCTTSTTKSIDYSKIVSGLTARAISFSEDLFE